MSESKRVIALLLALCMVLCFGLTACGSGAADTSAAVSEGSAASADPTHTDMTSAPEIEGLTFESELEREYATQFNVFRYEGGYKYFHIVDGDDFLLVPEDGDVPEDLPEDVTVLQAPVENIYLAATAQMALFVSMGGEDSLRMTSLKQDGWTFDEPKKLLDDGALLFAGKYSEPDYEMLIDENCELAIESTMIYHTPEVKEMIEELGIPVLVDHSSYESNPLGRMEWIKFYGELIGKEEEAKAFYDEQKAKVEALEDFENTEKTVAFFYISTDGKAMVRRGDDYIPAMIEMAGARYIFKDVDDGSGKQTIPMTMEAFYDIAKDADYIVYNASIDSSVKTLDDLLAKDPVIKEMKAVKEGNCWSSGGAMYQRTDIAGDMILDFHTLFTSDDPESELNYITKLK
jgi:iron complex transport system substrate-binding protein